MPLGMKPVTTATGSPALQASRTLSRSLWPNTIPLLMNMLGSTPISLSLGRSSWSGLMPKSS
ncbi:MAG: hypothetical protein CISAcid_07550 [uncultured Acidilobus sp. CIS]|nr:MAG: hypothetical protein CISAcid_07550 [uncultured Acidilobus sp. CIS]